MNKVISLTDIQKAEELARARTRPRRSVVTLQFRVPDWESLSEAAWQFSTTFYQGEPFESDSEDEDEEVEEEGESTFGMLYESFGEFCQEAFFMGDPELLCSN